MADRRPTRPGTHTVSNFQLRNPHASESILAIPHGLELLPPQLRDVCGLTPVALRLLLRHAQLGRLQRDDLTRLCTVLAHTGAGTRRGKGLGGGGHGAGAGVEFGIEARVGKATVATTGADSGANSGSDSDGDDALRRPLAPRVLPALRDST